MSERWPFAVPGIPDAWFERGNVPMTKEEVRTVALAKARLLPDGVVWDVGAGTGSLSVEAALRCRQGRVFAIERDAEAQALLAANARRFGVGNVELVAGEAPEALTGLPAPDRVLLGGSGDRLDSILQAVRERLRPEGRVVVLAVSLRTQGDAFRLLGELGFKWEASLVQVARSRPLGGQHLWQGLNPVAVFVGEVGA
ncbi:MAG: precorrin-6Y C5,15-methyltransferase (decarboxylating) subunit CbiT [Thermaerobacter sp.]|nr:precorrin-6Y C5,15-methyltransferase (decarboxylating) subunit CbiT [Thermaerobacter sp.]